MNAMNVVRSRQADVKRLRGIAMVALAAALLALGCATGVSPEEAKRIERAEAARDVAVDHLAQGRTAMAIRKLQQAAELNPTDEQVYMWLGEAYRRKGLLDRAEQNLLKALALVEDPSAFNHQETTLNLSGLYIQMKRYDEAIAICERLVDDPTFATPWRALTNRGWAQLKAGRRSDARASLEAAIDFHPRYSPALLNLGILEQKDQHHLRAIEYFERALEGGRLGYDGIAEANYRLAEIYVSLGKRRKAIEHFNVALERSPYGRWGTQSKSYLELLR